MPLSEYHLWLDYFRAEDETEVADDTGLLKAFGINA